MSKFATHKWLVKAGAWSIDSNPQTFTATARSLSLPELEWRFMDLLSHLTSSKGFSLSPFFKHFTAAACVNHSDAFAEVA